jgi:phage shock protein C
MICSNCRREIANESNFCYLCGARQPASAGVPVSPKRLRRSVTDAKLGGVCAGLAEYWNVDVTIVRLVWVLLVIFPVPLVPAVLGYLVAWIVIPEADRPVYAVAQPPAQNAAPQTQTH